MDLMGGASNGPSREFDVRVTQSALGYAIPWPMGTVQVQQCLLWVDGFVATQQSEGGKGGSGGGKGGGGKSGGSYYTYTADVVAALGIGPLKGIGDVWSGQSWLGNPDASESYTITGTGVYTSANASSLYNDKGVGLATTVSGGTYSDYGSPSGTIISSFTDYPAMERVDYTSVYSAGTMTAGQYAVDTSGKYYFNPNPTGGGGSYGSGQPGNGGQAVQVNYSYTLTNITQQENDIVPSSGQIPLGGTFQFSGIDTVTYTNTNAELEQVYSTPTAAGTFQITGSGPATLHIYTAGGSGGDVGAEITVTYLITDASAVGQGQSTQLNFTLNNGTMTQNPFAFLTDSFPGAALPYPGIAAILYQPMGLGASAEIAQNRFEVISYDVYGGVYTAGQPGDVGQPIEDCNPITCIYNVLTNQQTGLGVGAVPFPVAAIDNGSSGTWGSGPTSAGTVQSGATAWNWFAANGFFISPMLDSQDSASSVIEKWLEAGMCAAFMSEGLLKLVPYGDTTTAGNGCVWTAPANFIVALDDTCFVPSKENEDPVKIERGPYADAYNHVQVQWDNRVNQYAPEITQESDQASINMFGERIEDPQDWDFIHTITAATFAANMRVKHNVYIRNTYTFTLPYTYSYLEPMDIVTISTTSTWAQGLNNANLGVVNLPVRITKIVDDPKNGLTITAEDYPFGAHQPVLYNKQLSTGDVAANAFADPGNAQVVMFEATSRMTGQGQPEIWIGACGASENYGFTNIWVSEDNSKYEQIGTIKTPARMGVLVNNFGSSGDPDTTDTLVVQLAENCAALTPGSQDDADDGNTACIIAQNSVGEEVISYSACSATGQNTYTMGTYIRRGQMDTTELSFTAGALFMRLDASVFKYPYDPTWAGRALYFKFQAVNAFGNNAQQLSALTPTVFTVPGANPGTVDMSSGLVLVENYNGTGYGPLGWAPCYQNVYAASINAGSTYYNYSGMNTSYGSGVIQSSYDYFYNRFTGYLIPSQTGEYTIGLNSDDGANLYIGGMQVGTNELATQRAMSANLNYSSGSSATILLTKNTAYPIVIEWENAVAPWGLQLLWTTPKTNSGGGVTELIPLANLSTSTTANSSGLNLTIWNGSAGFWYPSGNGLTDPANTSLYGPPTSSGGTNLVNAVINVTGTQSSPQVGSNTFYASNPGIQWIKGQAYSAAGIVDIFLCCGSTTQGYMFRLEYRNGDSCLITKVSNLSSSLGTVIATGPANSGAKTGWIDFDIGISASGYLSLWVNKVLQCQVTDNIYAIGTTGNQVRYFYEVTSNATVGPAPAAIGAGSTGLNPQSSIVTFSDYPMSYSSTTSTITWSWSAFNVYFPDGSTIAVPASSGTATTNSNSGVATSSGNKPLEFTGLSASSTYYYSPFVEVFGTSATVCILATGTSVPTLADQVQIVNGDGNCALNSSVYVTAATTSSGTGGGTGGGGGIHGCFTGNVAIQTPSGLQEFRYFPEDMPFQIVNETGRHWAELLVHEGKWEMLDMGDGLLVTLNHLMKSGNGWISAGEMFPNASRVTFTGKVYNLHVITKDEADRHYILENGYVAHNFKIE